MQVFALPDLGEGLQEAVIVDWHVREGDGVAVDQPLVTVETDKAMVDIPAPFAGTVERLFGKAGDTVAVHAPLVGFAGTAADSGTVVGDLPAVADASVAQATASWSPPPAGRRSPGVLATPAVRALARDLGVRIEDVVGRGTGGAVRAQDVLDASRRSPASVVERGTRESTPTDAVEAWMPLTGVRRAMARRMTDAAREVVAVTVMDDADIGDWPAGTVILPRVIRALVAGCRAEPALNAWYDAQREARQLHAAVHLGLAIDTPDGLLQPVLRDCERQSPAELAGALDRLVVATRERQVAPALLQGHTIGLSNFGTIGGRHATPVVTPPAVAILGAGRASPRPAVRDGAIVARRLLPLSITFDHRAVTGGEAARFLAAVIGDLSRGE